MTEIEIKNDRVLSAFIKNIHEKLGEKLQEAWLFGSRARGDNSQDSDYDILLVADGDLARIREIVLEEEEYLLEKEEELIVSTIYNSDAWNIDQNSPLGWNIQKEGLKLV